MGYKTKDEDTTERRKTAEAKALTKIAFKPSKRQRQLESRKWLNDPLRPEDLYTGAELRRPR
jgi:hypothetical protein